MAETTVDTRAGTRPPPWRDVRVLRVVGQVVFSVAVAWLLWSVWSNLRTNLAASNLPTGYGFLGRSLGFNITDSPVARTAPIWEGVVFAWTNTIRLSFWGIILTTVLGIVIGIGRLSPNWLIRKATAVYVETFRNVPPLVWILLFFFAVFLKFPPPDRSFRPFGLGVFNVRVSAVPWVVDDHGNLLRIPPAGGVVTFLVVLAVALAAGVAVAVWRTRRFDRTGEPHRRVLWGGAVAVLVYAVGHALSGGPVTITVPDLNGTLVEGGLGVPISYSTALVALTLYTASHVAEIVRGSIQAVPKGQTEAAQALALSGFQRMRFVILPQAFRIMIPPLANQYLNFTKNTSLAIAVGYGELVLVASQITGNGQPAFQMFTLVMLGYLSLSLFISFWANLVNRSLALDTKGAKRTAVARVATGGEDA